MLSFLRRFFDCGNTSFLRTFGHVCRDECAHLLGPLFLHTYFDRGNIEILNGFEYTRHIRRRLDILPSSCTGTSTTP